MLTERKTVEYRRGVWYAVAAYVFWGLSPLFWNLVDGIPAFDLLLSRIVWSLPLLVAVITVARMWPTVRAEYREPGAKLITVGAALLLITNWGVFLWGVTNGHVVEVSLGYFINPLVSVALGVLVLGETLRKLQWLAVGIAAAGVLTMAVLVGSVPWISLILAFSFGLYGLLKKRPQMPRPVVSLFGEVAVLIVPVSLAFLFAAPQTDVGPAISATVAVFLIATGVVTITPLLLFGAAAKRIPLTMIGLLQYIAPTIQLIVGVWVLGETMTSDKLVGFIAVWIALGIYTYDNVRARDKAIQAVS